MLAPAVGNPRFPLVDSCRALAALSVLFFHVGAGAGNVDGALRYIGNTLSIGVPIFFCISGFLLYRPMANARLRGAKKLRLRDYARRRVLRIVPAYWVALTVLAIAAGWQEVFSGDVWRYYGFLQIYNARTYSGGVSVAWTLCIEVTFYLLLPLYAVAIGRICRGLTRERAIRREVMILLALGVASALMRAVLGHAHGYTYNWVSTLPCTFIWFVPGMLLALWSTAAQDCPDHPIRWAIAPQNGTRAWLIAIGAYAAVCVLVETSFSHVLTDDVATPLMTFFVVAPAVGIGADAVRAGVRSLPQMLLRTRLLLWLGMISYGIYLYHATLIPWLDAHGAARVFPPNHWIALAATGVAASVVAAAGSWYLVERPALRRKSSPLSIKLPAFRRDRTAALPSSGSSKT
jgi:peptidoglycan/LPS O-acetylase OafA/YrhL